MSRVVFVVPGPLGTKTGGFRYDRKMIEGLRARGWTVDVLELSGPFPGPSPATLAEAADRLAALPKGTRVVMDGLALSSMPALVEYMATRLRLVALMHLPLAADVTVDPEAAARLAKAEGRALDAAALVVITGTATLALLARYDVPPESLVVIEPGADQQPIARGSTGATLELLTVATLQPGKGYDVLLQALGSITDRAWHLTCAGSLTWHPPTTAHVRDTIARLGLASRVTLTGELDDEELAARYDGADVFVTATRQETYGMSVADALSYGLPVVGTRTGAIPDLVGDSAGVLVPIGDVEALAGALRRVMTDEPWRASLAAGARQVRERLTGWDEAARRMADALEGLDDGR